MSYDEPLLEYLEQVPDDTAQRIGIYVSNPIEDGSTIQIEYGSIPTAITSSFGGKKRLGIHTELLSDGIAELMMTGVVDNIEKSISLGKTVATFCMGEKDIYDFIDGNSSIEFRTIDYTNNPLVMVQEFFYSLSDESMYQRFISVRMYMPHEMLQDFVVIDYAQKMALLAVLGESGKETIAGIGQCSLNRDMATDDIALVVKDRYQKHGIGSELFSYLTHLARRKGLLGFTAEVLRGNQNVFKISDKMVFDIMEKSESWVFEMTLLFKDIDKIAGLRKPNS